MLPYVTKYSQYNTIQREGFDYWPYQDNRPLTGPASWHFLYCYGSCIYSNMLHILIKYLILHSIRCIIHNTALIFSLWWNEDKTLHRTHLKYFGLRDIYIITFFCPYLWKNESKIVLIHMALDFSQLYISIYI